MAEKKFYYGGQAVIEGVMMRGKQIMVTATRRPNGEIGVNPQPLATLYTGKWRKTPLIRGIIALIESLVLGIQTLMYSANVALEEEQTKLSGWAIWGIITGSPGFCRRGLFSGASFYHQSSQSPYSNHPSSLILSKALSGWSSLSLI